MKGVVVHYVTVHTPRAMKVKAGEKPQEPKYSIMVLMDKTKHAEQILEARRAMTAAAREKWGDKIPFIEESMKALKDGERFKRDKVGFGPHLMFVGASNKDKPHVVDAARRPLSAESGKPYNGSICNVVLQFRGQGADSGYGTRLNCYVQAVQFIADGERIGGGGVDPDEVFDDESGGAGGSSGSSASDDDLL